MWGADLRGRVGYVRAAVRTERKNKPRVTHLRKHSTVPFYQPLCPCHHAQRMRNLPRIRGLERFGHEHSNSRIGHQVLCRIMSVSFSVMFGSLQKYGADSIHENSDCRNLIHAAAVLRIETLDGCDGVSIHIIGFRRVSGSNWTVLAIRYCVDTRSAYAMHKHIVSYSTGAALA